MPRFCDRIYVLSVGVISADDIFGPWAFRKAWLLIQKLIAPATWGSGGTLEEKRWEVVSKIWVVLFFTCRRWTHFDEIAFQVGVTLEIMKAFYFQHVQQIHAISVLHDAKKERSLQKMLLRCDGNESQKTVFTHRVKSQVFSLECLSMDIFIKVIQGFLGLELGKLLLWPSRASCSRINHFHCILRWSEITNGNSQYSHSIYLDVSQK